MGAQQLPDDDKNMPLMPLIPAPRRPADTGDAKRDLLIDLGILDEDEHYNGDD